MLQTFVTRPRTVTVPRKQILTHLYQFLSVYLSYIYTFGQSRVSGPDRRQYFSRYVSCLHWEPSAAAEGFLTCSRLVMQRICVTVSRDSLYFSGNNFSKRKISQKRRNMFKKYTSLAKKLFMVFYYIRQGLSEICQKSKDVSKGLTKV